MRPIPVQQKSHLTLNRELMQLDDAEMALELIDLTQAIPLEDRRRAPAAPIQQSSDFFTELYSAASMIMDHEECEALEKELAQARLIRRPDSVAA